MDSYKALDKIVSKKNKKIKSITIKKFISIISKDNTAHWILSFFAVPLMIPVPLPPGAVTMLSIPLFLITMQMTINNDKIWIPEFIKNIKININIINIYHKNIGKKIKKIQSFSKRRLLFAINNKIFKKFTRFNILAASIFCLTIPIPMLNIVPATCIMIIIFGEILQDGLLVLIGIFGINLIFTGLYFMAKFMQDIARIFFIN
jgi:hypothetical protein